MTFPHPQIDYDRADVRDLAWEAACHRYLWLVFNRAPHHHIVEAADMVLRYVVLPGHVRRVVH